MTDSLRKRVGMAALQRLPPRFRDPVSVEVDRRRGAGLESNARLARRHEGARIFVIGNGPSLGGMDLRPLAREITIGMNSFYKHPHAADVGLKYLCVGDPHFMKDEPRSVEWHNTLVEKNPAATFMLHEDARPLYERHRIAAGRAVHHFRLGLPVSTPSSVNVDFTRPLNVGVTSGTLLGIPLALHLGAREIVI